MYSDSYWRTFAARIASLARLGMAASDPARKHDALALILARANVYATGRDGGEAASQGEGEERRL